MPIEVDISGLQQYVEALKERFGSSGEFLEQFLDTVIVPQLESQSGSQRRVRTGTYSGTWEASAVDEKSAEITTEAYYWVYLEFGTSKIAPKPVVGNVVGGMAPQLTEYLIGAYELG